jgi:ureidoglycolate lyase
MHEAPRITIVRAEPLRSDTFAAFGEVLGDGAGPAALVNLGTAKRYDHAARLANDRTSANPNLAVFHCTPVALPFRVTLLERHPHSSQTFVPLAVERWLVCAAESLADGSPDLATLRAFVATAGMGVNFRRGLWHHPILALDQPARFAMLVWEDGSAGDTVEWKLTQPLEVHES